MKIKNIKAVGEWVVIEARKSEIKNEEKKTSSGIILPGQKKAAGTDVNTSEGKETVRLYIYDIGPDVKNPSFKVGDEVIVDNYDIQVFSGGDDVDAPLYCLTHNSKIKCVVESE